MSGPAGVIRAINQNDNSQVFKNISIIKGDGFDLHLVNKFYYSHANIPGYLFDIKINGEDAGLFSVLIESDFNKISDVGNIGVEIKEKFRGQKLPMRVASLSWPFFKSHGQSQVLITYDEGNRAIELACRDLAAVEIDDSVFETNISKKRCIVDLRVPNLSNRSLLASV